MPLKPCPKIVVLLKGVFVLITSTECHFLNFVHSKIRGDRITGHIKPVLDRMVYIKILVGPLVPITRNNYLVGPLQLL